MSRRSLLGEWTVFFLGSICLSLAVSVLCFMLLIGIGIGLKDCVCMVPMVGDG